MKNKSRMSLGFLLAAVIAFSAVGCTKQTGISTPDSVPETVKDVPKNQEPAGKQKEIITLKMINRINADVIIENNPLYDAIEEATGIRLEVEAPPIANYIDRLQIVMASGDLPDMIYIWNFDKNYVKWAKDGMFLPTEKLVKGHPNLEHNVTPEMYDFARVAETGLAYAVPKPNKLNRWGMIINQSWVKKFGLELPRTIDELYQFGVKVANEDPDENGQKDTFLYSPVVDETLGVFGDSGVVDMFLPWPHFGAPDHDGEYKIREKMDGYYPYLEFLNKLYAEKIMDPEFFINKMYDDIAKSQQDRVAIAKAQDSNLVSTKEWMDDDKFEKFTFLAPMQTANGIAYNYGTPPVWGGWAISADTKYAEEVIDYLDWGNSPEGFEMLNLGVKGANYNDYDLATRTLDRTTEQSEQVKTILSSYTTVAYAYEGGIIAVSEFPNRVQVYTEQINRYKDQVTEIMVPSIRPSKYDEFTSTNPDLVKKKVQTEIKYIVGEISLDEFKEFMNNQYLLKAEEYEAEYLKMMANIKK